MALSYAPILVVTGTTISSTTENTNLSGLAGATSDGVMVNDNTTGTTHHVATYEGLTDPAGRAGVTVNEGDLWYEV